MNFNKLLYIISYLSINTNAELCKHYAQTLYSPLISQYPELNNELSYMSNQPLSLWVTDRDNNYISNLQNELNFCENKTINLIIYGLPGKDCSAGESSGGFNKNDNDYNTFISNIYNTVNGANVNYIIEPDAISLALTGNKCGMKYLDNIKMAINTLSQNTNSKLYLDVGYWLLIYGDDKIKELITIVNELDSNNKLKGFSLNLSNYRGTDESVNSCKKIRELSNKDYKCVIDVARNGNGPDKDNTWCNLKSAAIGSSPTENTGIEFIDQFIWNKPAIQTDGHCYGSDNSYHSNFEAGGNDIEWFKTIWFNKPPEISSIPQTNSDLTNIPDNTPSITPCDITSMPAPIQTNPVEQTQAPEPLPLLTPSPIQTNPVDNSNNPYSFIDGDIYHFNLRFQLKDIIHYFEINKNKKTIELNCNLHA